MKQISKYLIKLLYVIIIPLSVTYVFIEVLASDGTISTESVGVMFAFGLYHSLMQFSGL